MGGAPSVSSDGSAQSSASSLPSPCRRVQRPEEIPMGSGSAFPGLHHPAFVSPGVGTSNFPMTTYKRCRQERHPQQGATSRHGSSPRLSMLLRPDAAGRRHRLHDTFCAGSGVSDGDTSRERQRYRLFMFLAQRVAAAERDSAEAPEAAEAGAAAQSVDRLGGAQQHPGRETAVTSLRQRGRGGRDNEQPPTSAVSPAGGIIPHPPSGQQHVRNGGALRGESHNGARELSSVPGTKINGDGGGGSDIVSNTLFRGASGSSGSGEGRHQDGEGETTEHPTAPTRTSSGRARRQRDRRRRERAAMAAKKSLVKKVKSLGEAGQWRQAISEVDSAVEGGLRPDGHVYGSCVGATANSGRWQEALDILRRMRKDGVVPTTPVYNAAIKACARGGQVELAFALLEEMRFNANAAAAAAAAPPADAAGSVAESPTTGSIGADWIGVSWRGLTAEVTGREERVPEERGSEEVTDFFEPRLNGADRNGGGGDRGGGDDRRNSSRRSGLANVRAPSSPACDPDIQTINTVMSACARTGKWELALEVMEKAEREDGLYPTRVTYNTAISACGRGGEADQAVRLLREMRTAGLAPNAISFNSAIAACAVKGQWRRALSLLGEMEAGAAAAGGGIGGAVWPPPDVYSFGSAIAACGRGGQWALAVGLLSTMRRKGIAPGVVAFNAAISACGEAGQWERALGLLRGMEAEMGERREGKGGGGGGDGFSGPDRVSFNAAMKACSNAGEWQQAVSLLEEMRRNANAAEGSNSRRSRTSKDDTEIAGQELERRAAVDGSTDADPVRQRARKSGPRLTPLGGSGAKANDGGVPEAASKADRRRQRRRGRAGGPTPDVVSYSTAITACSRAGNWERAQELLEQMRADGLPPNSAVFTTMIAAWRKDWGYGGEGAREREARDALLPLLNGMVACGVTPDARLYGSALDACADASLCEPARALLAEMTSSGVPPDDGARRAVAAACAAAPAPAQPLSSSSSSPPRRRADAPDDSGGGGGSGQV